MARSGKRSIIIEAPIIKVQGKYIWTDQDWYLDFFNWLHDNQFKISGLQHMNKKLKLTFITAKDCTIFVLRYAGRKS